MRTTACVLCALIVMACRSPREPQPPVAAVPPAIELDAATRERLALGLPMHLEVHAAGTPVGTCTVAYDLWDEQFEVALSRTEIARVRDAAAAVRLCVDPAQLGAITAPLRVRELPHADQPRAAYPVF